MNAQGDRLRALCAAQGFDAVFVLGLPDCSRWSQDAPAALRTRLTPDPGSLLPGATRLLALLAAYPPYEETAGAVFVSPYYPASNAAYHRAKTVADFLRGQGYAALHTERFPYKAACASSGIGDYGQNGLIRRPPFGSRFVLQMILTAAPLAFDECVDAARMKACGPCGRCESACPTHALRSGRVDEAQCLRALPLDQPVPEPYRRLIGSALLGCDRCLDACPQNPNAAVPMPRALRDALDLPALLSGDVAPLAALIGPNFARKKRVQARAALICANLGRTDCLPLLRALCDDPFPALREHARWAIAQLTSEN